MQPEFSPSEYSRPLDELRLNVKRRGRQLRRRRRGLEIGGPLATLGLLVCLTALLAGGNAHRLERVTTDRGKAGNGQVQTTPTTVASGPRGVPPRAAPGRVVIPGGLSVSSPPGAGSTAVGSGADRAGVSAFRRLAFARSGADSGNLDNADIEVVNADGSGLRSLTGTSPFQNLQPAWSPDGSRIAFSSDRDNAQRETHTHFEVYVMNADGSGVRRLTFSNTQGNGASSPHWSPDGRRIVFADDLTNGNSALYVMNSDGSGIRRLTSDADVAAGVQEVFPAWSPDGNRIAFIRHPSTGPTDLVLRNLDGSHPVVAGQAFGQPAWSPDGRHLAVHVEDAATKTSRIEVLAADGSGATTIVSVPEPAVATNAAWSHDGTAVAFTLDPDGFLSVDADPTSPRATGGSRPASIHLVDPDGSHDRTLLATPTGSNDDGADFAWQ